VRVTTEQELQAALTEAAQAQREGRCALIEVILCPADIASPLTAQAHTYKRAAGQGTT
jgi:TPP-dependent 2-oxoacid decarboxylase